MRSVKAFFQRFLSLFKRKGRVNPLPELDKKLVIIRELIGANRLAEAIKLAKKLVDQYEGVSKDNEDAIYTISSTYISYKKSMVNGYGRSELDIERGQIETRLLQFLTMLRQDVEFHYRIGALNLL